MRRRDKARGAGEAGVSEGDDWRGRLVAKPNEPFGVGLSRMGSNDVGTLACVGATLGLESESGEVWNEDGTLALTVEQFRAGQIGILVLDPGTGHAPFELCLSGAGIKGLRVLLERLEKAMAEEGDRMAAGIAEGRAKQAPAPEFLPDEVDPGRRH